MKKYNIIIGVIFLVVSVGAYVISFPMTAKLPTDPLGPAWWPKYLSLALGLFSILLILQSILTPREKDGPAPFDLKSEGFHRVLILFGVLIVFVTLTFFLGIYIGLLLLVPAVMYLLGERKKKFLAGFSIGTCIFVFIVFRLLLKVPLPTGQLFC